MIEPSTTGRSDSHKRAGCLVGSVIRRSRQGKRNNAERRGPLREHRSGPGERAADRYHLQESGNGRDASGLARTLQPDGENCEGTRSNLGTADSESQIQETATKKVELASSEQPLLVPSNLWRPIDQVQATMQLSVGKWGVPTLKAANSVGPWTSRLFVT